MEQILKKQFKKMAKKSYKFLQIAILILTIFNMSYMGMFFIVGEEPLIKVANAQQAPATWPECDGLWSCTSNDVGINSLSLGDINGDPLDSTCTPGEIIDAYIWAEFDVKNQNEYAVDLIGNIYKTYNGDTISEVYDICAGTLSKNDIQPTNISSFSWRCGEEVILENIMIAYGKNASSQCGVCDDYTSSHCDNNDDNFYDFIINSPLISNFSYTNACDGSEVDFTDTTTGGVAPYTYEWDFDDSNDIQVDSTSSTTSYTYPVAGTYTVTLRVTDSAGTPNVDTQIYDVTVYSNPTADFSGTPISGENPLTVDFTDLSTSGDGSLTGWSWDFGDTNTSADEDPSYTYTSEGAFDVELSVTDEYGCSDAVLQQSYINIDATPICGDGVKNQQSEECDDGANGDDTDGCTDSCTLTYCGDDIIQYPNGYDVYEVCEGDDWQGCTTQDNYAGIESCNEGCDWGICVALEYCGDAVTNGNEECDGDSPRACIAQDNYNGLEDCSQDCTWDSCVPTEFCGDTYTNGNEECDDGANGDDSDGCTDQCTLTYCGDDVTQSPNGNDEYEECDGDQPQACETDQGRSGIQVCNSCGWGECISQETCGDGIENGNEECDDGANGINTDTCTDQCTFTYCGDATIQYPNGYDVYEICDGDSPVQCTTQDGYDGSSSCSDCGWSECSSGEYCGDLTVNGSEDCDGDDPMSCITQDGYNGTSTCSDCGWGDCSTTEVCGDNIINGNEECDDGTSGSETCTSECTLIGCEETISGYKYHGWMDEGAGMGGWEIELRNASSTFITATTTNESGYYEFNGLCPYDEYQINEVQQDGWVQVYPPASYYDVSFPIGDSEFTFTNIPTITGCKYNDANNNGIIDDGEEKIGGWEFELYNCVTSATLIPLIGNYGYPVAVFDVSATPTEPTTICSLVETATTETDIESVNYGCYEFSTSRRGTYQIKEVQRDNWTQTYPSEVSYYEFIPGLGSEGPYNFANYEQYCGDGTCNGDENCETCSSDCGGCGGPDPYCGDGYCNNEEDCSTCYADCGSCGGGGGGGGGGGTPTGLQLSNPQIEMYCDGSLVTVNFTWLTNNLATSRVLYDVLPHSNATTLSAPDYGYAFSTTEDLNKVTGHSMIISGLLPETVYYFRPVSSASPEVLGGEKELTQTLSCGGSEDEGIIVLGEEGAPDLEIVKFSSVTSANPGEENIEFTVEITNNGNIDAFAVILTDLLPDGLAFGSGDELSRTWEIGDIAPGETKTIAYNVNIPEDTEEGVYTNSANANATNHEFVSASVDLEVMEIAVLAETGFSFMDMSILLTAFISLFGSSRLFRRKFEFNF